MFSVCLETFAPLPLASPTLRLLLLSSYPIPSHRIQGAPAVAGRVLRMYAEEEGLDVDGLLPRSMDMCHQYLMVLARGGEWEQTLDFFTQLLGRARPAPDQNCFAAALHGLKRAGRWRETVRVMETFRLRLQECQSLPSPHLREFGKPRRRVYLSAMSTLLKVVSRIELAGVSVRKGLWFDVVCVISCFFAYDTALPPRRADRTLRILQKASQKDFGIGM